VTPASAARLTQRLSHRLGTGDGDDGVCASVLFPSVADLMTRVTTDDRLAETCEALATNPPAGICRTASRCSA